MEVNKRQRYNFLKKITNMYGHNLSGLTFACLGLAFKENTDDVRESVAVEMIRILRGLGAHIKTFDPQAAVNAQKVLGDNDINYCSDVYETFSGSDAVIVLTEWKEFKDIDLTRAKTLLKAPVIFDGRNIFDLNVAQNAGFTYFAVGKRTNGLGSQKDNSYMAATALLKTNGEKNGNS
jgi:UDPglucose 6-dehydrogenase